jgi:hypothetical protein
MYSERGGGGIALNNPTVYKKKKKGESPSVHTKDKEHVPRGQQGTPPIILNEKTSSTDNDLHIR